MFYGYIRMRGKHLRYYEIVQGRSWTALRKALEKQMKHPKAISWDAVYETIKGKPYLFEGVTRSTSMKKFPEKKPPLRSYYKLNSHSPP